MKTRGFGINVSPNNSIGLFQSFDKVLGDMEKIGFDYAEIPAHSLQMIAGGRINKDMLYKTKEITRKHSLKYTLHSPDALNLMNIEYFDVNKKVFEASLHIAYELECSIMVYHCGIAPTELTDESLYKALQEREKEELFKFVDKASKLGITICIENTDGRKVMGRTYGRSGSGLIPLVREVNSDNFGILYDLGHGYIGSKILGYDYIEDIKNCVPYIKHMHCHDNFGVIKQEHAYWYYNNYDMALPFGFEDLHLPPGWGSIPFDSILPMIKDYEGIILLEIHKNYYDLLEQVLEDTKKMFNNKIE